MKLIKINTDHYIIVDDSEIKEGDLCYDPQASPGWKNIKGVAECLRTHPTSYWNNHSKKITHSTQPLEQYYGAKDGSIPYVYHKIQPLSLSEVKELLGEFIQSLQPKTEWEVEMVDGKLKLM